MWFLCKHMLLTISTHIKETGKANIETSKLHPYKYQQVIPQLTITTDRQRCRPILGVQRPFWLAVSALWHVSIGPSQSRPLTGVFSRVPVGLVWSHVNQLLLCEGESVRWGSDCGRRPTASTGETPENKQQHPRGRRVTGVFYRAESSPLLLCERSATDRGLPVCASPSHGEVAVLHFDTVTVTSAHGGFVFTR